MLAYGDFELDLHDVIALQVGEDEAKVYANSLILRVKRQ